ncbi:hypothetical protein IVA87_04210 [Bradyrhizobium sp. 147]|uniref:hypothetical protein n=1 Tax=unclassified Bradyrhizobium TaxID=2631580 RepID=UPI001FFADD57|nr:MULTISPECIES: hypothetical protein [unclassified Bradyrhizobium]MCK1546214.1 hypothetical protein [Bradyrhizobium sp. 179]MCK1625327.1 hypothetical protein [Bradyrhizobium sp. 160]MCK1678697.1 hypothetical protein [Bradyrhizobium sp. 147]
MLLPSLSLLRQPLNFVATKWQTLIRVAGDPYRPELHYMRGPGPKWRAKYRASRLNRSL